MMTNKWVVKDKPKKPVKPQENNTGHTVAIIRAVMSKTLRGVRR